MKRDPEGSTAHDAVVAVPVAGNHDANAGADDGALLRRYPYFPTTAVVA